jgi:cell division protein FtsB
MKKALYIVIVIVCLLIINGLLRSIYDLWSKQDLLVSAQKELEAEKLKNAKLKGELSFVQSDQFIDETAHNKLFLVKPGEQQVLISKDLISKNEAKKRAENIPNWQKWLQLFF